MLQLRGCSYRNKGFVVEYALKTDGASTGCSLSQPLRTLEDDASSISSVPAIWSTPFFPRLTVKAADPFTPGPSHQLHTTMVYKVTGLREQIKKYLVGWPVLQAEITFASHHNTSNVLHM